VGDAACQLTKGFHFHGLPQFFFRLDSPRDIGLDADEELHVSGIIADRTQLNFAPERRAVFAVLVDCHRYREIFCDRYFDPLDVFGIDAS
jgi:hypothetical protein